MVWDSKRKDSSRCIKNSGGKKSTSKNKYVERHTFFFYFAAGYTEKAIRPSIGKGLLATQEVTVSTASCISWVLVLAAEASIWAKPAWDKYRCPTRSTGPRKCYTSSSSICSREHVSNTYWFLSNQNNGFNFNISLNAFETMCSWFSTAL